MAEEQKWIRYCAGECCEQCQDHEGDIFDADEEEEAKRPLHAGCNCTAVLVSKCSQAGDDDDSDGIPDDEDPDDDNDGEPDDEDDDDDNDDDEMPDIKVGDLLVRMSEYDFKFSGKYSFTVDVTNTGSSPLSDITSNITAFGGGKFLRGEIIDMDFAIGSIAPGETSRLERSGKLPKKVITRLSKIAILVKGGYTKDGKKVDLIFACWR